MNNSVEYKLLPTPERSNPVWRRHLVPLILAAMSVVSGCTTEGARGTEEPNRPPGPTVGTPGPASGTPGPAGGIASANQVFQNRSLTCGMGVDPPTILSTVHDKIELSIAHIAWMSIGLNVDYKISAPQHNTGIGLPIGPTPPTALLMLDGKIVGYQKSTASIQSFPNNEAFPLVHRPYIAQLTINQVCPGTTWAAVSKSNARYQVEVIMSQQLDGDRVTYPPARYLTDPLSIATTVVPAA